MALTAAVLGPFFLEVLPLRNLLVLNLAAAGQLLAGDVEAGFADSLGTDGESGEKLFQILARARRAGRSGRTLQHKQLEFIGALTALVLVNRHLYLPVSYHQTGVIRDYHQSARCA